jgi:hypothetical protein
MLNWKQVGNQLEAKTEFGTYIITLDGTAGADRVKVVLSSGRPGVEFTGRAETIGGATSQANEDYLYRQRMWEEIR